MEVFIASKDDRLTANAFNILHQPAIGVSKANMNSYHIYDNRNIAHNFLHPTCTAAPKPMIRNMRYIHTPTTVLFSPVCVRVAQSIIPSLRANHQAHRPYDVAKDFPTDPGYGISLAIATCYGITYTFIITYIYIKKEEKNHIETERYGTEPSSV